MKKLLVCFIAIAMSIGFVLTPAMADVPKPGAAPDPHTPYMYVDPGGIGDLLLFSLYDVRPVEGRSAGWENYIAIENTSGKWTAFHLRFRAWKKSIEVFDHVILLSPYDVFWMTLSLAGDPDAQGAKNGGLTTYPCATCPGGFEPYEEGDVIMFSGDKHTLWNSGLIYENYVPSQTFWLDKFQDSMLVFNGFDSNDGAAPKSELQAGYIEAIGLWQLSIPSKTATEDTHILSQVVNNVHDDPLVPGTINVYDALDALFYRFFTSAGAGAASATTTTDPDGAGPQLPKYACTDKLSYTGCWTQYPIIKTGPFVDSAWPDFVPLGLSAANANYSTLMTPVKIEHVDEVTYSGLTPLVAESPGATRLGLDCGNVLAGMVYLGDPTNGKFQMENFIALKNFRTDIGGQWAHAYYTTDFCDPGSVWNNWQHRDGYQGGGIFFPASITDWYYQVAGKFTGGAAELYLWYYVNPDYSTAAGPITSDGNDFFGSNFNDVNYYLKAGENNAEGLKDGSKYNPLVANYGLTRPWPLNEGAPANSNYAYVHYFNDIWSLDDLEAALAKFQIWYTHLRTRMSEGAKGDLNTDVVLTYPTKHAHWFFTDWPFMIQPWAGYCPDVTTELVHRVFSGDVNQYWANLLEYRGNSLEDFEDLDYNYDGEKSVEELIIYASAANEITQEESIAGEYNQTGLTIAQWFQLTYYNGRIFTAAWLWDNEQNKPSSLPPLPPPGSPWEPSPRPTRWLPHEVNIVRVGEPPTKWNPGPAGNIDDANWLLLLAQGQFGKGQFSIQPSYLNLGQRGLWDYKSKIADAYDKVEAHYIYYGSDYVIPPIGVVILNHDFGTNQTGVNRSAMAEWHYVKDWIMLPCKDWDQERCMPVTGSAVSD